MFKRGERVELAVTDISRSGQAIGRSGGIAIFTDRGVIGDTLFVEITKVKKNMCFARTVEVLELSKARIESICRYAGECGGCQLAETSYDVQLSLKEKHVEDALTRIAKIENPPLKPIERMEDGTQLHYRNKASMPISTGGNIKRKGGLIENLGKARVGFYKARTHEVIDCEECKLQTPAVMAAVRATKRFMDEDNITAWDEKWEQGLMKQMVVRTAFATNEVMITYEINGRGIPNCEKLIGMLDDEIYEAGYYLESVNLKQKSGEVVCVAGAKVIKDKIGALNFEISPESFYQVNPQMTKRLYDTVRDFAQLTGKEYVLDLYCGVGSIGLYCADSAKYVIGIEVVKQAVIDANRNAAINGIVNAQFLCGKAEDELMGILEIPDHEGLAEIKGFVKKADVVILDPPRAGCDIKLIDAVATLKPQRVVYVSCDPASLARDIKLFCENGYKLEKAKPFDMFAWTGHVECVSVLHRKSLEK